MSNSVLKLLANTSFITVNKPLARELGLYESIILGELMSEYYYWESRDELEDGMFFSTIENLQEQTTLSDHQQRTALKHLQSVGLLTVKSKGLPARRYIKLDLDAIEDKLLNILNTSSVKIQELEVEKVKSNNNNINNNNINNKYLGQQSCPRYY